MACRGDDCRGCRLSGSACSTMIPAWMPPGTSPSTGMPRSVRRCGTTCRASASRPGSGIAICSKSPRNAWRRRRGHIDPLGRDESRHLEPLERIIDGGRTPAEEMLEKFHGPWQGSVEPAYDEYAF